MIPSTTVSQLPQLAAISCEGFDALKFLQGLVTCNVATIKQNQGSFGAVCDVSGRVLATFFLGGTENNYYLLLPSRLIADTIKHLKKYILRSKVNLDMDDGAKIILPDPLPSPLQAATSPNETAWRAANINLGFVWIYPETRGLFLPQMINLQKWGGVSFNKGCYTGQEIVARTEHLGKLKRNLYYAEIETDEAVQIGEELKSPTGQALGFIVEAAKITARKFALLAVLQDQMVATSQGISLMQL